MFLKMSSFFEYYQNFIQNTESSRNNVNSELTPPENRSSCRPSPIDQNNDESVSTTTASSIGENSSEGGITQMEHSYMRECNRNTDLSSGLTPARTVLVRRAPQCPSCHTHPMDENELNEANYSNLPIYDEICAKEAMHECARIAKYVKNHNPDDEDWEAHVNKFGWSSTQQTLFEKVARILDLDQLARLANESRPFEAMQRRGCIDKSTTRMRRVLASVAWEPRITQWLHALLMDHLPSTYMASYLDIIQTLKTKLPTLTDKMLFSRPFNISQELLAPVMKQKWEPVISTKQRQLSHNAIMVALPTLPINGSLPRRLQNWYKNLSTITEIVQITLPNSNDRIGSQSLEQVAETIVSLTRVKIHELRTENPNRGIILIGFNAGAALALQVSLSESIACVICMGFAYNTLNGVRGSPDDRILDIKAPILFVIGQNSQRTSQEEMEYLRERLQSESSLVVVGSADDSLRVPKSRRKIENVTQHMVDSMVADEVYEYINRTLTNPPGPRLPTSLTNASYYKQSKSLIIDGTNSIAKVSGPPRKRRQEGGDVDATPAKNNKYVTHNTIESQIPKVPKTIKPKQTKFVDPFAAKRKVGRPRTRPLMTSTSSSSAVVSSVNKSPLGGGKIMAQPGKFSNVSDDHLNMAMQCILDDSNNLEASNDAVCAGVVDNTISATTSNGSSGGGILKNITGINTLQKPTIIPSVAAGGKPATLTGAKIKMIPPGQFVHLKPFQSQSKIYTIKTGQHGQTIAGTSIGSIVKTMPNAATTGQQQIFTLKTPTGQTTQFVTAAPANAQQKYTVVKNPNGMTTLQLTKNLAASGVGATSSNACGATIATTSAAAIGGSKMDLSNIIDMPIIFADGDGNVTDNPKVQQTVDNAKNAANKPATSNLGKLILSQKIIKEANPIGQHSIGGGTALASGGTIFTTGGPGGKSIIVNKSTTLSAIGAGTCGNGNGNKVVYLNRNTMKPCTNVMTRTPGAGTTTIPQYTKFVLANPKTSGGVATNEQPKIMKTVNFPGRQSGIFNVGMGANKIQLINKSTAGGINTTNTVSVGGDKPQIRNFVVKSGGLKQIPQHFGNQLLNRNLTVRKLNIVPGTSKITGIGSNGINTITTTNVSPVSSSNVSEISASPTTVTISNSFNNTTTTTTSTTSPAPTATATAVKTESPITSSKND